MTMCKVDVQEAAERNTRAIRCFEVDRIAGIKALIHRRPVNPGNINLRVRFTINVHRVSEFLSETSREAAAQQYAISVPVKVTAATALAR
jgi:predicted DNA-binding transcriptional regulator YafY